MNNELRGRKKIKSKLRRRNAASSKMAFICDGCPVRRAKDETLQRLREDATAAAKDDKHAWLRYTPIRCRRLKSKTER